MAEMNTAPLLLRIPEAAAKLAISRAKLYEMIHDGHIPVVRLGGAVRVSAAILNEWVVKQGQRSEEENHRVQ